MRELTSFLFFVFLTAAAYSQNGEELYLKAKEALQNDDEKAALKYIDEALEVSPDSVAYLILRTNVLIGMKRFSEAFGTVTEAIRNNPANGSLYDKRASMMSSAGYCDEAMADYALAIRYAEDDTMTHRYRVNRAATNYLYRHYEEAYEELGAEYAFDSTDVVMLSNLAMVSSELKKYEEALKHILRVIELDPDFEAVYSNAGFIYQNMGEHEKAIAYFDKSIEADPEEPYGHNNRAYSKLKIGDLKGAMADVETSLKLRPSNAYAYRNRALIWIEMGKMAKACEDLQTAIDKGFLKFYGPEAAELQSKYCR